MSDTMNTATEKVSERRYYTMTPRIVTMLCETVYELALWTTVKEIAGEDGECYLSTPDLAALSMMSTGKAAESRKSLMQKGLLEGELRRDPGFPQPVWHLVIPDLWPRNIEIVATQPTLRGRIQFKKDQRGLAKIRKELSCGESSLYDEELSPGERGPSPDERGPSPGETKKNQKVEPVRRSSNPTAARSNPTGRPDPAKVAEAQRKIANGQAKKDKVTAAFETEEEFRESLCSLAQFIEKNSPHRKFRPGQSYDKLLAMAPPNDPRYPSPQDYYLAEPDAFGAYVLEQIAWADNTVRKASGKDTKRKPIGSLVSAITNYARPDTGWFAFLDDWRAEHAVDTAPESGTAGDNGSSQGRGQSLADKYEAWAAAG